MRNQYLYLLRQSWQYSKEKKSILIFAYILFTLSNILLSLTPLLLGWFISNLQNNAENSLNIACKYVIAYILICMLQNLCSGPGRIFERKIAFYISQNFLEDRYNYLSNLSLTWHRTIHSNIIANRLKKAYTSLNEFTQNGYFYIKTIIQLITSTIAIIYFSPLFGTIAILLGLLTIYIILLFDKPYVKSLDKINNIEHVLFSVISESLHHIFTILSLRLQEQIHRKTHKYLVKILKPAQENIIINEWRWIVANILVAIIYCVIAFGYVYTNYGKSINTYLGGLIILVGFTSQFTNVFYILAVQYNQIVKYNTDFKTSDFLVEGLVDNHHVIETNFLPEKWRTIRMENLNFSYKNEDELKNWDLNNSQYSKFNQLNDINLSLHRGQKVAIIGSSGSGKSTILTILKGLYRTNNSSIVVDGQNVTSDQLNNSVTLFVQKPEIFTGTVRYNLTFDLSYTDIEISNACEMAEFQGVVSQLANGLDTQIQESGRNLSSGQQQRLILARGILAASKSSVILLDEPTSNLDQHTEKKIYQNLFSVFSDRLIVSAIHHMHLLPLFDYIYVLENGGIIKEGTFVQINQE